MDYSSTPSHRRSSIFDFIFIPAPTHTHTVSIHFHMSWILDTFQCVCCSARARLTVSIIHRFECHLTENGSKLAPHACPPPPSYFPLSCAERQILVALSPSPSPPLPSSHCHPLGERGRCFPVATGFDPVTRMSAETKCSRFPQVNAFNTPRRFSGGGEGGGSSLLRTTATQFHAHVKDLQFHELPLR